MRNTRRRRNRIAVLVLFAGSLAWPSGGQSADPNLPTGWLGLGITCHHERSSGTTFLLVHGTAPDGPAARAGVEAGDIIAAVDDRAPSCADQLDVLLLFRDLQPGTEVAVSLIRRGVAVEKTLKAVVMSDETRAIWKRQWERLDKERRSRVGNATPPERSPPEPGAPGT